MTAEFISIDLEQFIQRFLQCPVCLCPFNRTDHLPKMIILCQHTICVSCAQYMARHWVIEGTHIAYIRCPICRGDSILASLRTSLSHTQLIDFINSQPRYNLNLLTLIGPIRGNYEGSQGNAGQGGSQESPSKQ